MWQRSIITTHLMLGMILLLGSCGGGGSSTPFTSDIPGGGSSTPFTSDIPPPPPWTMGNYQSPATFAAHCSIPRSGINPATNQPYPDILGSATWENHWLRSWTNAYYLWYTEVADVNPFGYKTPDYFDLMKTFQLTVNGNQKDRFHFTYTTANWYQLSQVGTQVGYGVTWALLATRPPRKLLVAYTDPNTPAAQANVTRGASVLKIDDVDQINASDQASIDKLNAGMIPSAAGESHSFLVQDTPDATPRLITLTAINVTLTPVQNVATFVQPDGQVVGYLQFNEHIATAESQLIAAFNQLLMAGVTDLIIDLRYNGGGYLDIASEVAFMIAGPGVTTNQTFEKLIFNNKYPNTDPFTDEVITPVPFLSTSQGFSTTAGKALPHLDLARVFVLTTNNTCSASESIINSLRGVNLSVVQIGSTTCGKPYGFYPTDNCGTTYFSINFEGVNNVGFGDYPDGFTPSNSLVAAGVSVPGCSVADDFSHQLGDPNESLFAAALAYRSNGTCPTASGKFALHSVANGDGRVLKPEVLMNRILRSNKR